ncbi:hypothetical protein EG329_011196 [Mollisiaceae sp. DMI_Dod_QoI]|nr:hypothetical protein EG329_011196 [Helotiales sp. DMI_Dod_QoI]
MSDQPAPSIPASPAPGKDPPPSNPASTDPKPEAFSQLPGSPMPPDSAKPTSPPPPTQDPQSKDKASMAPPPIRPTITTQPPSRSTTFHPSTLTSQNADGYSISEYIPLEEKPRPAFAPFFTLVNDVKEKEGETGTYHPSRIHYLFSDDDASELLSSALLRTLEQQAHPQSHSLSQHQFAGQDQERSLEAVRTAESTTTSSGSSSIFKTHNNKQGKRTSTPGDKEKHSTRKEKVPEREKEKVPEREREERIVIVDINDTGESIKSVSSLSKDWQVLGASIDNAPTWDGAADGEDTSRNAAGGLMLRIEGVSIDASSTTDFPTSQRLKGKVTEAKEPLEESGTIGEEEMQGLLEGFDRKMAVLRRVVGQQKELCLHQHQHQRPGSTLWNREREGSGGSNTGTTTGQAVESTG